jgi:hypothetical protein
MLAAKRQKRRWLTLQALAGALAVALLAAWIVVWQKTGALAPTSTLVIVVYVVSFVAALPGLDAIISSRPTSRGYKSFLVLLLLIAPSTWASLLVLTAFEKLFALRRTAA